jgi:hypothetical protein
MTRSTRGRTATEKAAQRVPVVGDKVSVTITGHVTSVEDLNADTLYPSVEVTGHDGFVHNIYPYSGMNKFIVKKAAKAPVPFHATTRAGQVWVTTDGFWFARISNPNVALRFTPADLSDETKMTTLAEDDFFRRYPDAILAFNDGWKRESEMTEDERRALAEQDLRGDVNVLDIQDFSSSSKGIDVTELLNALRRG